jgi:hypothetical protein
MASLTKITKNDSNKFLFRLNEISAYKIIRETEDGEKRLLENSLSDSSITISKNTGTLTKISKNKSTLTKILKN